MTILNSDLEINGLHFQLFIRQQVIEDRIDEMAEKCNQEFHAGAIVVSVMTGAFYFSSRFLQGIVHPYRLFSVQASSYQGLKSTEQVRISFSKDVRWIKDAHVLILEDIIDSGQTAWELEKFFYSNGAAHVEVVALFYKPGQQRYKCNITLQGFEVGPEFLVGYGLDVDEEGRYLKDVYKLINDKEDWDASLW